MMKGKGSSPKAKEGKGGGGMKSSVSKKVDLDSIIATLNQAPSDEFNARMKLKVETPKSLQAQSISSVPSKLESHQGEVGVGGGAGASSSSGRGGGETATEGESLSLPLPTEPNFKLLDLLEELKLSDRKGEPPTMAVESSGDILEQTSDPWHQTDQSEPAFTSIMSDVMKGKSTASKVVSLNRILNYCIFSSTA